MEKDMKPTLITFSLVLFAQFSMAGFFDTNYPKEYASIEKEKANTQTNIANVKKKKEYLEKKLATCMSDRVACSGAGDDENDIKAEIKNAEASLKSFQSKIDDLDAKYASKKQEEKDFNTSEQTKKDAAAARKAQIERNAAERYMNELKKNATTMKEDLWNIKFDVSDMGRKFDKHDIGQYVAAKMGLMLNSQAFCEAKARCDEPKGQAKRRVTAEELQKEIFSGMNTDIFKGVDFYQKSHEGMGTSATPQNSQKPAKSNGAP
jgi:chromosome segregation ATPase